MKRISIKLTACAIAVMMSAGVIFPAQFTSVYAAERIEDINKEDGAVVELGQKSLAGQLDAPEGIHCKSGEDYITLTWDEVDGADAYRVYKYDPVTKTFEKYKSIAGTSCKITDLSSGTSYVFKISALDKTGKNYTEGLKTKQIKVKTSGSSKTKKSRSSSSDGNTINEDIIALGKLNGFTNLSDDTYITLCYSLDYKKGAGKKAAEKAKEFISDLEDVGLTFTLYKKEEDDDNIDYCYTVYYDEKPINVLLVSCYFSDEYEKITLLITMKRF